MPPEINIPEGEMGRALVVRDEKKGGRNVPPFSVLSRLLKNAYLLRCATNLIARRISIYASLFGFCAPCI